MSIIGTHSAVWTPHDTTENTTPSVGFVAGATESLTVKLRKDSATRLLPVLVGMFYPFDLKLVTTTGTPTAPVIIYGSQRAG
jgi:hypothetical protein